MAMARTGEICSFAPAASARFSQPSAGGFETRSAGFHIILRIEMRARRIGRAGGVHDGEVAGVVDAA